MAYFSKKTIFMKYSWGLYSSCLKSLLVDETYNHYNLLTLHITHLCKYFFWIWFIPLSTKTKMVSLYVYRRS